MGKKKSRAKYESKGGLGGRLTAGTCKKTPLETVLNKWEAFKAGKKAFVTIPNPNTAETAKRWIRVEMKTQYQDPKKR